MAKGECFVGYRVTVEAIFTSSRTDVSARSAALVFAKREEELAQLLGERKITVKGAKLKSYSLPGDVNAPPPLVSRVVLEYLCKSVDIEPEVDHGKG